MAPNAEILAKRISLSPPPIGLYHSPEVTPFLPVVTSKPGKHECIFSFYENWRNGETLHITKDNFGCGEVGYSLCGIERESHHEIVKFLVEKEGLKASCELMNEWLDHYKAQRPTYPNILIGPFREKQYEYLRSVTFFVNPDQLSALMLGAQFHSKPCDSPVIAPFGSGCMHLLSLFDDLRTPKAIIGATDIAMRHFLPPEILTFTVTKSMYEQLCALDERSFLYKGFWKHLRKVRGLLDHK